MQLQPVRHQTVILIIRLYDNGKIIHNVCPPSLFAIVPIFFFLYQLFAVHMFFLFVVQIVLEEQIILELLIKKKKCKKEHTTLGVRLKLQFKC